MLRDVSSSDAPVQEVEFEDEVEGLGRRVLMVNARRMADTGKRRPQILLAFEDVTSRRGPRKHAIGGCSSRQRTES
jgi:hypothetical protein